MNRIAESFAWPFRASPAVWLQGAVAVLLVPVLFIPLLGYAVAATRAAEIDAAAPPPHRFFGARSLRDGWWVALLLAITALPFALIFAALIHAVSSVTGQVVVFFAVLLVWGLVTLSFVPHATAAFAASGRPADLFNLPAAWRGVRRDFSTWNVVVAAIVTAWAIGLACVGLLCVGFLGGMFYAILVSAHAAAALHPSSPAPSAR